MHRDSLLKLTWVGRKYLGNSAVHEVSNSTPTFRCHQMSEIRFPLGLRPRPCWGSYSAPQTTHTHTLLENYTTDVHDYK